MTQQPVPLPPSPPSPTLASDRSPTPTAVEAAAAEGKARAALMVAGLAFVIAPFLYVAAVRLVFANLGALSVLGVALPLLSPLPSTVALIQGRQALAVLSRPGIVSSACGMARAATVAAMLALIPVVGVLAAWIGWWVLMLTRCLPSPM